MRRPVMLAAMPTNMQFRISNKLHFCQLEHMARVQASFQKEMQRREVSRTDQEALAAALDIFKTRKG